MTCDVAIKATPRATGVRTAQLVIGNDTLRGERRVDLRATGLTPVSKVGWVTTRLGPGYSYNLGQSLARSASSSTTYLHATYTTDRVSGAWVDDNGPYAGSTMSAPSNRGSTFTTPKRLNPSKQHGSRGSLAASGKYVYATWVSTSRWIAYRPTAPRVLYLRRNSNHGSPDILEHDEAADVAERPGRFPDRCRRGRERVRRVYRQRDRFRQSQDQP